MKEEVAKMGLDNGLVIKTKKIIDSDEMPEFVKIAGFASSLDGANWEYEVCYWRKCWNIRRMILNVLNMSENNNSRQYEVTISQLVSIREGLYDFLTQGYAWDDSGDSIWDFNDMIPTLAQNIVDITWAIEYLKKNPYAYIYFYDSY